MKDSLKLFMNRFPHFLDKSSSSNFYKVSSILNSQFRELYNELFKIHNALDLDKKLWIWKVQSEPQLYTINFVAQVPNLKSVTCWKNDEVIYSSSYEYDSLTNRFIYSYTYDNANNNDPIIPLDLFRLEVETWDEYYLVKGFPENDNTENNIYDHDTSLDNYGKLHNIPRKNYIIVEDSKLNLTEPPYNNRQTEDDYHYMKRILEYILHLYDTPLPVLEIWKLFGINLEDIELINRERFLLKFHDETRHLNEYGEYDNNWKAQEWEHHDYFCNDEEKLDTFFFVNLDNSTPLKGTLIHFSFQFMNMYAEPVDETYTIIPYLNGEIIDNEFTNSIWTFNTNLLDETIDNIFSFKAYLQDSEEYLESEDFHIIIKGCGNADYFVDPINGDDNNDGSKNYPFQTINKAISSVEGMNNTITLIDTGRHIIENSINITQNCSILACENAIIENNNTYDFFTIAPHIRLDLQNITLRHKCCLNYSELDSFIHEGNPNYPLIVHVDSNADVCLIPTEIILNVPEHLTYSKEFTITGLLQDNESNPVVNENLDLFIDDIFYQTINTDSNGIFTMDNLSFDDVNNHSFQLKHYDSNRYCESISEIVTRKVNKVITSLSVEHELFESILGENLNIPFYLTSNADISIPNQVKLYKQDELLASVDTDDSFNLVFDEIGSDEYTIRYEGNEYFSDCEVTIIINVVDAGYIILDLSSDADTDIDIRDSLPESLVDYSEDDYIILTDESGDYHKLIIVSDESEIEDYNLSDDDIVLVDKEDLIDYDLVITKEE